MIDKDVTALVPMKANSERVPEKNIREFNGRPLFHWILGVLNTAETIETIVVNTDSEQIAQEAAEVFDVEIINRPEELRGDYVSMNEILLHDVSVVDSRFFLQTHCTNPLLRPETVDDAVKTFVGEKDHDSLFSVTPHKARLWDGNGNPINHDRNRLLPTQELQPVYEENSNLYLFTDTSIKREKNRIGDNPLMYEMEEKEAIDIDVITEFNMAEYLHRDRYGENPQIKTATGYEP